VSAAKIYLDGYLDIPPDRREDVLSALPKHVELTLAEPGCLKFEVVESTEIAGRLLVSEIFVDQAAFEAHQTRNRASDWFRITAGIERHFEVREG
jgi:quinol monooxygenase YgiN